MTAILTNECNWYINSNGISQCVRAIDILRRITIVRLIMETSENKYIKQ